MHPITYAVRLHRLTGDIEIERRFGFSAYAEEQAEIWRQRYADRFFVTLLAVPGPVAQCVGCGQ